MENTKHSSSREYKEKGETKDRAAGNIKRRGEQENIDAAGNKKKRGEQEIITTEENIKKREVKRTEQQQGM